MKKSPQLPKTTVKQVEANVVALSDSDYIIVKLFKEERANWDEEKFTTSNYNGLGEAIPLQRFMSSMKETIAMESFLFSVEDKSLVEC